MRENITYKRGSYDGDIIEILRGGPIKYTEFRKKCLDEIGMGEATFRRRLLQLEKYGIIQHTNDVRLIEEFQEANPKEIREILKIIQETDEEVILQDRIKKLQAFSRNRRIAHFPRVVSTFKICLQKQNIINNQEIWKEFMLTLSNVLNYEKKHHFPDSDRFVEPITKEILEKVVEILKKNPAYPDHYTIRFLGESMNRKVIDILFQKIATHGTKINLDTKTLGFYLGRKYLYSQYFKEIDAHIFTLLKTDNEMLQKNLEKIKDEIYPSGLYS